MSLLIGAGLVNSDLYSSSQIQTAYKPLSLLLHHCPTPSSLTSHNSPLIPHPSSVTLGLISRHSKLSHRHSPLITHPSSSFATHHSPLMDFPSSLTQVLKLNWSCYTCMLSYLVLEKIFYNFWESFAKLIGNFAKINDFIFAKYKIILSNFRVLRKNLNAVSQPP